MPTRYEHIFKQGKKVQVDSAIRDGNGKKIDTNYALKTEIPAIPPINDGILTIQKNGVNIATFTANASNNVTANLEIPIASEFNPENTLYYITTTEDEQTVTLQSNLTNLTEIDWGDGSVSLTNESHIYATAGDYTITLVGVTQIYNTSSQSILTLKRVLIGNIVTSIGQYAFYNCTNLNYIEFPNSITNIGSSAFQYCSGLTSITIPTSVTSIGRYAFSYCTSFTNITIPNSITNIEDGTFTGCSDLINITIPDSVMSIGSSAFIGCNGLTSITIPDSITNIGMMTFKDCTGLTNITIPNSVTSIKGYALTIGTDASKGTIYFKSIIPPTITTTTFDTTKLNKIYVPKGYGNTYKTASNWSTFADYIEECDLVDCNNSTIDINKIFDIIYPVGSIYMSVNNTNPGTYILGTTWEAWGAGRVPLGVGSIEANSDGAEYNVTAGEINKTTADFKDGEKTHTLTTNEIPSHTHEYNYPNCDEITATGVIKGLALAGGWEAKATTSTGGNISHNNLQPYITCYMWKRTA